MNTLNKPELMSSSVLDDDDEELGSDLDREQTPEETPVLKRQADVSLGRYAVPDPGEGDVRLPLPSYHIL